LKTSSAPYSPLFGKTFEDFDRMLRYSSYGTELPPIEQCVTPRLLQEPLKTTASHLVYVLNFLDQKVYHMSENVGELLGYSADWFIDGGFARTFSLIHPQDEPLFSKIAFEYMQVREKQVPKEALPDHNWTMTFRMRRVDGSYIWFLAQHWPVCISENGRVPYALVLGFDVTSFYPFYEPTGSVIYTDQLGKRVTVNLPVRADQPYQLTSNELEVLPLVGKGLTSHQIGQRMSVPKSRVDVYRRNIRTKTQLSKVTDMGNLALAMGMV
jgi:DNA-binding CsgD family transcriptional regulator